MKDTSSAVRATIDHARYLYSSHRDSLLVWTVLVLPSMAMCGSLVWIGFETGRARLGDIFGMGLSVLLVVLAIIAFTETFPLMPAQALSVQLRYRIAAGWAYLGLSAAMIGFFFFQLSAVWALEPAGKIPHLAYLLALVGIGGALFLPALLIGVHKLPQDVHDRIVEFEFSAEYTHRVETMQRYFGRIMTYFAQRVLIEQPLNSDEERHIRGIIKNISDEVGTIERNIIDELTRTDLPLRRQLRGDD